MRTGSRSGVGRANSGSDAEMLVRLFRVLTEEQFDYWIACLNRAVRTMGGDSDVFTRDDRQKTISYWYLLMYLLEHYAARSDPFAVGKGATWVSDVLVPMKTLSRDFETRYKVETIRRYVFDLKQHGLIALEGRGGDAMIKLSAPVILALADTIRQWVRTFRDVDRRISKMGAF